MSVLLDIEEVRRLVRGPNHGGFTSVGLKERMQTTDRVARALMAHGYLKTEVVVNPVNRCPTVIVSAEEGLAHLPQLAPNLNQHIVDWLSNRRLDGCTANALRASLHQV
jgi:hypothetical protein